MIKTKKKRERKNIGRWYSPPPIPSAFQEVPQEREAIDVPLAPGGRPIGWRRTRLSKRRSPGSVGCERRDSEDSHSPPPTARLPSFFRNEPGLYSSLLAPGTKHSISDRAAGTTSHPALSQQFHFVKVHFHFRAPRLFIYSHPHSIQ